MYMLRNEYINVSMYLKHLIFFTQLTAKLTVNIGFHAL